MKTHPLTLRSLAAGFTLTCGLLSLVQISAAAPAFHSPFFPTLVKPASPVAANDPDSQTLADIDAARQAAVAAALTLPNRDAVLVQIATNEVAELENFVQSRPISPWTPSLQAVLGEWHRRHGRFTWALDHWEAAWNATQDATAGPAKEVADYALAHWTRLLASLGRVETLGPLLAANQDRVFSDGAAAAIWSITREAYAHMVRQPGLAYKCGVYALNHVARTLYGTNLIDLEMTSSPVTGFSLADLQGLSDAHHLGLVAVARPAGDALVVPSVVHWTQNHYAAIVGGRSGFYDVRDPTFGGRQIMDADTLNAEASGYFLVPAGAIPPGWHVLSSTEAAQVFGRGYPFTMPNQNDQSCTNCSCAPGAGGSNDQNHHSGLLPEPGSGCAGCGAGASGMPVVGLPFWKVSEPYINLWVYDTPLAYQPAIGPPVRFELYNKQRPGIVSTSVPANYSWVGWSWSSSWLS